MRAFVICILLLIPLTSLGQSDKLQEQISATQREIERIDKLLQSNKNKQNSSLENLQLIDRKIKSRHSMVADIDSQVAILQRQIGDRVGDMSSRAHELDSLRSSLCELLKIAYKSYRISCQAPPILGTKQGVLAARRAAYVGHITREVASKALEVNALTLVVQAEIEQLRSRSTQTAELLEQKRGEMSLLEQEKAETSRLTSTLRSQESQLIKQAAARRAALDALQRKISAFIEQETTTDRQQGKAVDVALAARFEQNKGRLPLPVASGVIVGAYGVQPHPTERGVKVTNKGVNIACTGGSTVKSVFDGLVKRVFLVEGLGSSVIVRHGAHLSVYANLSSVNVKAGETIKTGSTIGQTQSSGDQGTLHFEIWRETQNLDPTDWVRF